LSGKHGNGKKAAEGDHPLMNVSAARPEEEPTFEYTEEGAEGFTTEDSEVRRGKKNSLRGPRMGILTTNASSARSEDEPTLRRRGQEHEPTLRRGGAESASQTYEQRAAAILTHRVIHRCIQRRQTRRRGDAERLEESWMRGQRGRDLPRNTRNTRT